ncbi:homoserine kinase [Aquimarina brevivitae]|uniref:Homoserine kinase n=1 Tax=Aquimarina brevivitae TaxID=323412 RepID=A0A4Q7P4X9_9FLAO|nr:homoserine kinase [Aquimarina brevivitae]RZS93762.1 homoserine kinase [Aquimarina brevivitae]
MKQIKIFSPATIANLSCGFDVLGCCLDTIGDEMKVSLTDTPRISIEIINGANLPTDPEKNVAGVATKALLEHLGKNVGVHITITKGIKAGSGIGSSAASSAGAVWAVNQILGSPLKAKELIPFAMEGERAASGNAHADNVAPALLGGFTLVRSYDPLEVIGLPSPADLYATVIHPHIEIKTSDSRSVLKKNVTLEQAITQWGNLGGLIAGLYTNDYGLIGRSLKDVIIEPLRSILIPAFKEVQYEAVIAGALGCGISGSGPSIFALSKGREIAHKVGQFMGEVYATTKLDYDIHISKINPEGIRVIP